MAESSTKILRPKDKSHLRPYIEQTRATRVFMPDVDIYETEKEIILLADMPGVTVDNLNINLKDNILTLDGEIEPLEREDETQISKEFGSGRYYRQFSLTGTIDQSRIKAELKDGVLKLSLPKMGIQTSRKIQVKKG